MLHTEGEDNVGHSSETTDKVRLDDSLHFLSWMQDPDTDHSDDDSRQDTHEGCCKSAAWYDPRGEKKHVQTIDSQDIFTRVRGKDRMKERTIPTTPNTIEQVPCPVMVFIAMVKVRR